jgi:hypothetical protein
MSKVDGQGQEFMTMLTSASTISSNSCDDWYPHMMYHGIFWATMTDGYRNDTRPLRCSVIDQCPDDGGPMPLTDHNINSLERVHIYAEHRYPVDKWKVLDR